jgi:Dehydrogenases with different specificities (related to short-chain alcohol dehydrogenases)
MKQKIVLITGASRGIGKAAAKLLSKHNYFVIINYNKSESDAIKLKAEIESCGYNADIFKADISNESQVKTMINYISKKYGSIDILINNAGIAEQKLFTDITINDWNQMFDVNIKSIFLTCKNVLPKMINKKYGKIINISSIWGITGASCEVHYSASKAAVIGFSKALAKEVAPSNICVNVIAPGIIETDMLNKFSYEDKLDLINNTPVNRLGTAEDIAKCMLFLCSDDSNFITGQVISPNGGFLI